MRNGLAEGRYQIVHGAVDNAVAMAEVAKADIAVVMRRRQRLEPADRTARDRLIADLRGKTVIVDAPNTAYALQLYDMLAQDGLKKGDYEVKVVGARSAASRRSGRQDDRGLDAQSAVLGAGAEGRAEESGLGREGDRAVSGDRRLRDARLGQSRTRKCWSTISRPMSRACAGRSIRPTRSRRSAADGPAETCRGRRDAAYEFATDPAEGLAKDGKVDIEGFRNVLKLRARTSDLGRDAAERRRSTRPELLSEGVAGL